MNDNVPIFFSWFEFQETRKELLADIYTSDILEPCLIVNGDNVVDKVSLDVYNVLLRHHGLQPCALHNSAVGSIPFRTFDSKKKF